MKYNILIIFLFAFLRLTSQDLSGYYKLKNNSKIAKVLKKEFNILKLYDSTVGEFNIGIWADSCNDSIYRLTMPVDNYKEFFGVLSYKGLEVFIVGDNNVKCKLNYFLVKEKDTIVKGHKRINNHIYYESNFDVSLQFDGPPQKGLYWYNLIVNDTLIFVVPYYEIFYKFDTIAIKSNFFYKFTNYKKQCYVNLVKLNLRKKIDSIKYIYFKYFKKNDTIFNYEIFYPLKLTSELKYLTKLIINELKKQRRLKDGYYIGEAIIREKKMYINFTYIINCKP